MKLAIIISSMFFCAASVNAATLTLKSGAPLVYQYDGCEGRPCGPDAHFSFEINSGFKCNMNLSSWDELVETSSGHVTTRDLVANLDLIKSYSGSTLASRKCLEYHPEDASLCLLERSEYMFFTGFGNQVGLKVNCSQKTNHKSAELSRDEAIYQLSKTQAAWVVFSPW